MQNGLYQYTVAKNPIITLSTHNATPTFIVYEHVQLLVTLYFSIVHSLLSTPYPHPANCHRPIDLHLVKYKYLSISLIARTERNYLKDPITTNEHTKHEHIKHLLPVLLILQMTRTRNGGVAIHKQGHSTTNPCTPCGYGQLHILPPLNV